MKKKSPPYFARRKLSKEFKKLDESGKTGRGTDSTQLISEDREDDETNLGEHAEGAKLDPTDRRLAAAYARGRGIRKKLEEAEGGSISAAEAAAHLRISVGTVQRWYHAGKIIGWQQGEKVRLPVWQFVGGKPLPGLEEVLTLANKGWACFDDYGRMLFLLSKSSAR
jgi:excisionase family DNA binding protein